MSQAERDPSVSIFELAGQLQRKEAVRLFYQVGRGWGGGLCGEGGGSCLKGVPCSPPSTVCRRAASTAEAAQPPKPSEARVVAAFGNLQAKPQAGAVPPLASPAAAHPAPSPPPFAPLPHPLSPPCTACSVSDGSPPLPHTCTHALHLLRPRAPCPQTLVTQTTGFIKASQEKPYGDILVRPGRFL